MWCKRLDTDTFTDSRVIKQSEQFVPVKINTEEDRATARKFKASSLPTILIVTAKGERIDKIVGYLPPEQFANKLQSILTIHRELSAMEAQFKADPTDLATGGKLGAAYASRYQTFLARRVIRKLEAADPNNTKGHLTDTYLAMGEYYLDEKEQYASAIRWYNKVVERGHEPAAVAVARYRIALAYFAGRTKHSKRAEKFGDKLRSAQAAIDALLAMSDIRDDLRRQTHDLARRIRKEMDEHERVRNKN